MPAMSVTTLVLTTLSGDYNADGAVSAADYVLWRKNFGSGNALPNGDDTPGVGMDDFARWRSQFGQSASGLGAGFGDLAGIPEPTSILAAVDWRHWIATLQAAQKLRSNAE